MKIVVFFDEVEFSTYDVTGKIMDTDNVWVTGLSPGSTGSAKSYATYFGKEKDARIKLDLSSYR